jgi:hypothetical protein
MQGYGLGGHDQLTWDKGKLVFVKTPLNMDELKVVEQFEPSPQAWERFWKALDAAGVWKWQAEYRPVVDASDGEGWSLVTESIGQRVNTRTRPQEKFNRFFVLDFKSQPGSRSRDLRDGCAHADCVRIR